MVAMFNFMLGGWQRETISLAFLQNLFNLDLFLLFPC